MSSHDIFCPTCTSRRYRSISSNLHTCLKCGIAFNSAYKTLVYDDNYFLDEYKKQYGKTYLDDYNHIYKLSQKRLNLIFKYLQKRNDIRLLDIGSAMGFFLKCALDSGITRLAGIEISEYASSYCKKEFDISISNSPFSEIKELDSFDIVTAWYFIEHCENPLSEIKKIAGTIPKGGVFAFSTPSIFGPLFKFNIQQWIDSHPKDHRVDFSPSSAKKILKNAGFRKVYIKPAGIHPERILSKNSIFFGPFSFFYGLFSRITAFSDTIEVYAVK
ncbi:MAG: class I SAM-dependent methyltransferase [bacterium]|nr:class I SAM-dependent methyltransferase [bacterium]